MKQHRSNADVFSDETLKYVQRHLGNHHKRILEVGCGAGDFGLKLMQTGISLTACDTDEKSVLLAQKKGVPAIHIDFLLLKDRVFDAIVFTRSLHHIHQLQMAIEHAKSLLVPGGMLIVEEFDVKMIDVHTARWYYDTRSIVSLCVDDNDDPRTIEDPMQAWIDDHHHEHALNTGEEMIKRIEDYFHVVSIERNAYLYRSICGKLDSNEHSYRIARKILMIENRLIQMKTILPNGLRIVATK